MIISIGAVKTKLDGIDIGSVISNDVSMSYTVTPIYIGGQAKNPSVPHKFIKSRANGTLSVTSDELPITGFIDTMLGISAKSQVKVCSFDATCISGEVYPIPQFSISVPENGFPTITVSPVLKSATLDMTSISSSNNKTCNLNFVNSTSTAAITVNKNDILSAVTINGKLINSLTITSGCNYELIYDDTDTSNMFPIDCILHTAYINGECSFTDFTDIGDTKSINLQILTVGNNTYSYTFSNCSAEKCGFKSSNGYNTWQLKFNCKLGTD